MRNRLVFLLFVACGLLLSPSAKAGLALTFDQSTYTVAPGGSVDVSVYLTQTGGTTVLTDEGLASYGIRLSFSGPSAVTAITSNPGFDLENVNSIAAPNADAEYAIFFNPPVSPVGDSVLLATFTFAGAAGTTQLSVDDLNPDPGFINFTSGTGTNLDGLLGPAGTAVINPNATVPEPSSLALFGAGMFVLSYVGVSRHGKRASS